MSLDFRPDTPDSPNILAATQFLFPDKAGNYKHVYSASAIVSPTMDTSLAALMDSAALGARMVRVADGTPSILIGTTAKIVEVGASGGGTTIGNASKIGGYATGSNRWWFCSFGDTLVASNYADSTQARTGTSVVGTAFADLSGAPKAKFFLSQQGYLLAFNYNDGTAVPNGVKWATQGSSTTWTASAGNTAGNAILRQSPGAIVAGAEIHDIVAVWKKDSMYAGRIVGGAGTEVWRFDLINPKIGCVSQEAWAATPVGIIFVSNNGIYRYDGSVPVPIDRGVRNEIYRNLLSLSNVQVSHDEASQCVFIWSGNSALAYAYNYACDKWSLAYLSSTLGNASFTTMTCVVRDSNYADLALICSGNGTNASYNRAHLVISSEKKCCNLQNPTPGTGINAVYNVIDVRDPKANPDSLTNLARVTPIYVYNPESGNYDSEPASGSMTVNTKPRVGAPLTSTASVTMDPNNKRFDCNVTGNTLSISISHTAQPVLLADLEFSTTVVGTA